MFAGSNLAYANKTRSRPTSKHLEPALSRTNPKKRDWNATELLAAARKTVNFEQCRFRFGTALDNEA